jgi:hypothetical protein
MGWLRPVGPSGQVARRPARNADLLPGPLDRTGALTRQPVPVLEGLTALRVFQTFWAPHTPIAVTVSRFFLARGMLGTVALDRRYCPRCLQEALAYRLLWQFREVTVCFSARPAATRGVRVLRAALSGPA